MTAAFLLNNLWSYTLQAAILIGCAAILQKIFPLRLPRYKLFFAQALLAICVLLPGLQPWRHTTIRSDVQITLGRAFVAGAQDSSASFFVLPSLPSAILAILIIGTIVRLAFLIAGLWRVRQFRKSSEHVHPVPSDIAELQRACGVWPDVCVSNRLRGPVTFGLFRPVVLFPPQILAMEPRVRRAIVSHEIIHVRRYDWGFNLVEEFVRAILWFHPCIWWLVDQIHLTREQTVDAEVLQLTVAKDDYLEALLTIAGAPNQPELIPAPLFLRKHHLKQRIAVLLKEVSVSTPRLIFSSLASALFLTATAWVTIHSFPLEAAPQSDSQGVAVQTNEDSWIHRAPVEYPSEAKDKHIEGTVILELSLGEKGDVTDARVLSGPEELRNAALQSVLQWHSATRGSAHKSQVAINFVLPASTTGQVRTGDFGPSLPKDFNGTVKRIMFGNLSQNARKQLQSQIHLSEGDAIDSDAIARLRQTVHDFDEHINVAVMKAPDSNDVSILMELRRPQFQSVISPTPSVPPNSIRVGGNVQATKLTHKETPVYPPLAKQARIQGTVRFNVTIAKDGTISNITLVAGHPLLVPPAQEALAKWTYQPTLLNGQPVEVVTTVDINFTLLE